MKKESLSEVCFGIAGASILIGLALMGASIGSSLSNQTPLNEHMLLVPGLICLSSGSLYLFFLNTSLNKGAENS